MVILQNLESLLVKDVLSFGRAMSTLPWKIQIWALLFPFPQFIFGFWSAVFVSFDCIGAYYLYVRAITFVLAGQVHKQRPFSKLMGPIMHAPFLLLVPVGIRWILLQQNEDMTRLALKERVHFYFVVYTTIITTISLVLDGLVFVKWMMGKDVGRYDDGWSSRAGYQPVDGASSA
jgi:hypothetical protein